MTNVRSCKDGGYFPHHTIGLETNPFRVLKLDELRAVTVLPSAIEPLVEDPNHLQIVADAGRGKTTLLRAIEGLLVEAGHRSAREYIPEGSRDFRTPVDRLEVLLLDEADRLARSSWGRLISELSANRTRLVFTAHRDQASRFRRGGAPLRTVRPAELFDREHLARILSRRIERFTLPGTCAPAFSPAAIAWLASKFGCNLRTIEAFLFDVFQELTESSTIAAEVLDGFWSSRRQSD